MTTPKHPLLSPPGLAKSTPALHPHARELYRALARLEGVTHDCGCAPGFVCARCDAELVLQRASKAIAEAAK